MTPPTVMWFRRDLRLADNPALVDATRAGDEVVPLFVLDPHLWDRSGDPRRRFLLDCLRALDESLDGHLVVRHGPPAAVVPAVAAEVGATEVFAGADFGPYGQRRDQLVADALTGDDRALRRVGSPYAVPPGELVTGSGTPFKVFTPFSRAWRDHGWPAPIRRPRTPRWAAGVDRDPWPTVTGEPLDWLTAGEAGAKAAARRFWDHGLDHYDEARDRPGEDATSRLSPHLKLGTIHPRQLLSQLDDRASADRFATELCWREFYADVLHHRPETAHLALQEPMRRMEVDHGPSTDDLFAAWVEGRTGFPLVDAGMRQLGTEGWMHNRVRMVTASFLVKDLHLDWTRGARVFMDRLVDGDLASNQHGWQWTAGTGTDPSPYFRVFNPVSQSQRFDPDGSYLHRWLPELRSLDAPLVHQPWKAPDGPPGGYPPPIVDHAEERVEALRRYGQVTSAS